MNFDLPPALDRLRVLHDHLKYQVLPERFDLVHWAKNNSSCGTSACAIGHACEISEFRAAGLSLNFPPGQEWVVFTPVYADSLTGSNYKGWEAVKKFFRIDQNAAFWLFNLEYEYEDHIQRNTISATCQRIREFIERHS